MVESTPEGSFRNLYAAMLLRASLYSTELYSDVTTKFPSLQLRTAQILLSVISSLYSIFSEFCLD
jgi:hypothetical protein